MSNDGTGLRERMSETDDPRDEEYRAHSGMAGVAIAAILMFVACILQRAFT